jgi:hypothetical protein
MTVFSQSEKYENIKQQGSYSVLPWDEADGTLIALEGNMT